MSPCPSFASRIAVTAFLGMLAACSRSPPSAADTGAPVDVAQVVRKSVPELIAAVGTVEPIDSVAVKSRVDGQLLECRVQDGGEVSKGTLLFKIDPRPAQAALAQSEAALAKDMAARDLAKAQLDRYEPVATKGYISDDQMQQYRTAYAAAVASARVDQANVEAAQLTLSYTDIYAPISGRAGRVLVQPGNLVKANDTQPLLTLNRLKPIYVNFAVPGQYVARIRAAQGNDAPSVTAAGDGIDGGEQGDLAFIDNAVDPATNTVKLRANFANDDERLWPGGFVNITLTLGTDIDALVVPDAAVKAGPNGSYVFLLKADGRVEQRAVTVARDVNGEAMIAQGLAAGDTVVTDGQSRLVDGSKVKVGASK